MVTQNKKSITAKRYTLEQKNEIIQFINDYRAKFGRGAQREATKKFGVSAVTITNWMKATPKKRGRKPGSKNKPAAKKTILFSNQSPEDLRRLAEILEEIKDLEEQVAKLDALRIEAEEISKKILG